MNATKTILIGLLAVVTGAWLIDLLASAFPGQAAFLWAARQQGLYLSGVLSIAFMSLSMFLSIRPAWLETPLGGLDHIDRQPSNERSVGACGEASNGGNSR